MTRRQLDLFHEHLPYADMIAALRFTRLQFASFAADLDDLQSFARMGLKRAAERYLPGRAKFRTFASRHIHGAITDGLREFNWWGRGGYRHGMTRVGVRDLDATIDDRPLHTFVEDSRDRDADGRQCVETDDFFEWLSRAFSGVDRIILDGMRRGLRQQEIAATVGLSESRISQRQKLILERCARIARHHHRDQ